GLQGHLRLAVEERVQLEDGLGDELAAEAHHPHVAAALLQARPHTMHLALGDEADEGRDDRLGAEVDEVFQRALPTDDELLVVVRGGTVRLRSGRFHIGGPDGEGADHLFHGGKVRAGTGVRTGPATAPALPWRWSAHTIAMRHSILALLLFFTLQVAAQAPAVHEARPRMLADAERIAWMQAHHQHPGPFGDAFA